MPASTPARILTLEDLRSARNPNGVKTIFSKLGYNVQPRLASIPPATVGFNSADAANIHALYLLATQGNPDRETALQIVFVELEQTAMIRLRSLAKNFLDRGVNILLVATTDNRFLHFVHPRHDEGKVRIRKLVVDTIHPTRHDLDILENLAVKGRDPSALYIAHQTAFDIERVTKRFYQEYADIFKKTAIAIAINNRGVRDFPHRYNGEPQPTDELEQREIDNLHEFTQRLMGRLMFLYFLQKKGWLNGDSQFLTNQYRRAVADEHLYFGTVLVRLFFDVLNARREGDNSEFGNIPYLNGGLFDRTKIETNNPNIYIPNSLFDPNDGGILEFFNRHNFTVTEETPIEQEVAVDPEMLGKVFENMMEERARQNSGTFYTPRPIVQYMCREVLTDFLLRDTSISVERLTALFESDEEEQRPDLTVAEARRIESALEHVRILDPAVGTGAFLVGALQEIIALRRACQRVLGSQVTRGGALIAQWKREIIAHSLYGVDLKPEAVEIAKLRLWLSLVVDLERDQLEPLPNLTYKLRVGNSLLETIDGESILPDLPAAEVGVAPFQNVLEGTGVGVQMGFDMDTATANARTRLSEHKERYFAATDKREKERLRQRIENEERQVVLSALKVKLDAVQTQINLISQRGALVNWKGMVRERQNLSKLALRLGSINDVYTAIQNGEPLPFFLYRLHFFEVFRERGGFDIVLANPPYVRHELIREQKPALKIAYPEVWHGSADLYVYFYARALNLLRSGGLLAFISSNKFMRIPYGKNLRTHLVHLNTILSVIDFGDTPIFDATTYPAIIIIRKQSPEHYNFTRALNVRDIDTVNHLARSVEKSAFALPSSALTSEAWMLEDAPTLTILQTLRDKGTSLGDFVNGAIYLGIKTGCNEAFMIDDNTRRNLIALDPNSANVIVPYLRGRDVKQWHAELQGQYIILIKNSGDKNSSNAWSNVTNEVDARRILFTHYPAIHDHLSQYEKVLRPRADQGKFWWELRPCAYYDAFTHDKIVYPHFNDHVQFAYDTTKSLTNNKAYIIPSKNLALLGLLNSTLIEFFIRKIAPPPLQRGYFEYSTHVIEQIPVPNISYADAIVIERIVNELLNLKGIGKEATVLQSELDQRIYYLFGLSLEEIRIVEQSPRY